ncbi:MAG: hypothetical protein GKR94_09440 [Gammaproteobacteria bacterium]|nr:hypothetical protein [Gammaproteobacteria bacterium]
MLDDTITTRRGKKMEGVSSHFDHVTNRHVMGHQVLTLGLATPEVFFTLGLSAIRQSEQGSGFSARLPR